MKKYLILIFASILLSACSSNGFSNRKFKLVSVTEVLSYGSGEVGYPEQMLPGITCIWTFTGSEINIIKYDTNGKETESNKMNYHVDGSFLYLEDEKVEIRHTGDTIDLYHNSIRVFQMVPTD